MADDLGFAGIYDALARQETGLASKLEDVKGSDWRNILVLGRATSAGVYPETLALVGRARYMADELGCRVEVALIGESLDAATEELRKYPIDTVYRVKAPDYAPIDHTATLLEQIVRKRRPELVLVFQSRSGDAITAYAANRLGVGFVTGASRIDIDTAQRKAVVTHESGRGNRFQVVTAMQVVPQFVSVQRGLFRAPLEDPYANVKVHELKAEWDRPARIEVLGLKPPPVPTLETAERVVVAGARIRDREELELARTLARRLDAAFGITTGIVERGLSKDEGNVVGVLDHRIAPRLLVTVGVRGALDLLEGIGGDPLVCAIGCDPGDPIGKKAAYVVVGEVRQTVQAVLDAL
jgi:electron transfer flavoprotein alpha subunit